MLPRPESPGPQPVPPLERRPTKISVTDVDRLKADPYAFNALARVVPSHLMDGALFDFTGLRAGGGPRADGDIAFDDEPCAADGAAAADPTAGVIRFAETD